ncbi:MAG: ATP-dependent helicase, partial [Planctomycetota bacterium]
SEAICSIGRRRSWALTGTPVENSADDLVGIFEFVAPGLLTPGMRPRQVAQNVRDHVLRRTKDAVLEDLPPKLVRDAELRLTPAQYETYREAEEQGIVRLSALGDSITVQHVFQLILRLKQICNFDPVSGESAKLTQLEADLEEIAASGKKAIVFSQWVKTLMRLSHKLARFGPLEYHGRVPARRRDEVIERFRRDERAHVILMSYGAGGVGLNLQFAQYVFLFDRWWNPAVEDQAIARAHRVGATGAVTVSRYLAVNTIEERINQILIEKRELFDTIFADSADGPGRGPRELGLSRQEIFGLFDWQLPGRDAA